MELQQANDRDFDRYSAAYFNRGMLTQFADFTGSFNARADAIDPKPKTPAAGRRSAPGEAVIMNRRAFLSALGMLPLARVAGESALSPSPAQDAGIRAFAFSSLAGPLTPNEQFYIRDHFPAPDLSDQGWTLEVSGNVRNAVSLKRGEILGLSRRDLTVTLECAGNGVGRGGVSTAKWTGVALRPVLERAGLLAGTKHVRFIGADRGATGFSPATPSYSRSIPVEKALHPDTLLAYAMNGAALPREHGYPLRAIIPGWYGMDSVKWLIGIEALTRSDTSFFMTQAYMATSLQAIGSEQRPVTRMRVKSQIAHPREGELIPRGFYNVRGAAWAGENAVARVEVSTDAGKTWSAAQLETERRPYVWTLWEYDWNPGASGSYILLARATDDQGGTQPIARDSLRMDSYEQNSYHSVRCEVI